MEEERWCKGRGAEEEEEEEDGDAFGLGGGDPLSGRISLSCRLQQQQDRLLQQQHPTATAQTVRAAAQAADKIRVADSGVRPSMWKPC